MRIRCSVFIATSVDGYIARADGGIDWLALVEREGEDYGFAEFYASVDTLIMGRTTYETALGFATWPYEGKRVVVLTHRPLEPRAGVTTARGTPAEILATLDDGVTSHVYVDGGKVVSQFLAARVIERLTLSIIPIILGEGIRLFPGGEGEHGLTFASARAFPSGLVQLRYALP